MITDIISRFSELSDYLLISGTYCAYELKRFFVFVSEVGLCIICLYVDL